MRIGRTLAFLGVVGVGSACSFQARIAGGDDVGPLDALGDATHEGLEPPDAGCAIGSIDVCAAGQPGAPLVLAGPFDSDGDVRCRAFPQAGGPEACLLYAESIAIVALTTFTATGTRPLVLVSTSTIAIDGLLDVASRRGGLAGAGANAAGCVAIRSPEDDPGGAAGGAGGSYRGAGGDGGEGDQDNSLGPDGTALGGLAGAAIASAPTLARGGCPGTTGGDEDPGQGGSGGASGGAVWLAARGTVTVGVGGGIRATGAGGGGGQVQSGGGGGGSGGLVVIEATSIAVGGMISANGGGGGEGGTRVSGTPVTGNPGSDGDLGDAPAAGGAGAAGTPGDGGAGSAGATLVGGIGGSSIVGGGGGGGGAGFVHLVGPANVTGSVSPPAS